MVVSQQISSAAASSLDPGLKELEDKMEKEMPGTFSGS